MAKSEMAERGKGGMREAMLANLEKGRAKRHKRHGGKRKKASRGRERE
jgi:hypothetical protein